MLTYFQVFQIQSKGNTSWCFHNIAQRSPSIPHSTCFFSFTDPRHPRNFLVRDRLPVGNRSILILCTNHNRLSLIVLIVFVFYNLVYCLLHLIYKTYNLKCVITIIIRNWCVAKVNPYGHIHYSLTSSSYPLVRSFYLIPPTARVAPIYNPFPHSVSTYSATCYSVATSLRYVLWICNKFSAF
jgi:hypothetical protein